MVFSSLIFLIGFFPVVLILYELCPGKLRNLLLLLVSLVFYAWGEPVYVAIMLFSTVFDYANGRALQYFDRCQKERARTGVLILSIVVNIGILSFFKYTDFFLENVNYLTERPVKLLELALPIGISFYTFQTLSYTIDVYRRKVPVQENIIDFGMYICLFPQLIAGPIVRYSDIQTQIANHPSDARSRSEGMQRFLIGLGKKVLLANQAGALWTELSSMQTENMSVLLAWLGAIAFSFQIYFDFSGYSDMAIGIGKILGFQFPENFRHPYESRSMTEFWRRWHITLGTWFREYVYIPMGGNRKGILRQIFNLMIVWLLTGMWHGAGWNFILWAGYYFLLLLIEKLFLLKVMKEWPVILQHLYGVFFIILGWAIFACEDISLLTKYLGAMFGRDVVLCNSMTLYYWSSYAVLLLVWTIGSSELPSRVAKKACMLLAEKSSIADEKLEFAGKAIFTIAILFFSLAFLVSGSYNPFLYFRF